MTKRRSQDREAELLTARDEGLRIGQFLDDPAIAGFFDAQRTKLVEAMIAAPIGDDDQRRDAAHMIKAFDALRNKLQHKVGDARRADADLKDIEIARQSKH